MTKLRLDYVQAFKDRHGKQRFYFRRPGHKRVTLPGAVGSEAFMAAYQAAMSGETAPPRQIGAERTKPGSISALCVAYYGSSDFKALAATTQSSRRNILERLRADHGDKSVANLRAEHVAAMLDAKAETPAAANNLRKVMRAILAFAVERNWRRDNPALGVKRVRHKVKGFTPWSRGDVAAFEARWPAGSRERLALYLLLGTSQRRGDVTVMGRQHLRDGRLQVRQSKTGAILQLEIHPALQAELDRVPATQMTFLVTYTGAPFSPAGFTNWFVAAAKAAGLEGRTPHGLRKSTLTFLADSGATAHELQSVSGHANIREVETYTKAADQKRLASSAIGKLTMGSAKAEG